MNKHMIWQNIDVDIRDFEDLLKESYPEIADENAKLEIIEDINYEALECERMNLDIPLEEDIIVFADLGLWNGRKVAYRETHKRNIKDILYLDQDCDYGEFFVDGVGNLRSNQMHHDGTNSLLYRMWKPSISGTQKENFLAEVYQGQIDSKKVTRYTTSLGKKIKQIYGWE